MKKITMRGSEKASLKDRRGITLIALVITIILLLLLAGITISQLMENGLLKKAELANELSIRKEGEELLELKIAEYLIEALGNNQKPTLEGLKEYLKNDKDIEYIDLYVGEDELKPVQEGEKATCAKVKLKKYKYEYTLNQRLEIVGEGSEKENTELKNIKLDAELEKLLKEANMAITLDDILNTPAIMEQMKGLIPKLTEADVTRNQLQDIIIYTTNKGEIIRTNSELEPYRAWKAFDEEESTSTVSNNREAEGYYLEYEFQQKVYAMQVNFKIHTTSGYTGTRVIVIQAYDEENAKWIDLTNDMTITGQGWDYPDVRENLEYSKSYKKYRFFVKSVPGGIDDAGNCISGLWKMQLYGVLDSDVKDNSKEELKQLLLLNYKLDEITLGQMTTNKEFMERLINLLSIETIKNNETLMANLPQLIDKLQESDVTRNEKDGIITYTTNKGEMIRTNSEINSSYQAWRAFDEDYNTSAISSQRASDGYYIEYEFCQKVYAMQVKFKHENAASKVGIRNVVIQAYDEENTNWINLTDDITITGSSNNYPEIRENLECSKAYKKYRLFVSVPGGWDDYGDDHSGFREIQLYGKRQGENN